MIEPLARLGYASKALIYVIIGALAAGAALHRGGRITDTSGALRVILRQPFGRGVLIVLALGLCGYAIWRILDGIRDPERRGTSAKGLAVRIGSVFRGLIYGGLAIEAIRLLAGLRGSSGREAQMWTARVLDLPFGAWVVGLLGLIVAGYGIGEVGRAIAGRLEAKLDLSAAPAVVRKTAGHVSRLGVVARGAIIAVLGVFLVRAAIQHDPSEVRGTRQSIIEIANAVEGRWLLAFIAAGLIAYGIDQALHARYRRIEPVS